MPLQTPYGVIVGPLHDYDLVNPSTGQWPHYHVRLSANGQVMDSAINLKSKACRVTCGSLGRPTTSRAGAGHPVIL
jgi:hypothetical protein